MVPEGWVNGKLGDFLKAALGGGTPDRKEVSYWGGTIPWASVKDFSGIRLSTTSESITESGLNDSATRIVPANTVIIPTRMAVGKAAKWSVPVAINQDLKALLPKPELDSEFLLHWILGHAEQLLNKALGSTVKGVRLEVVNGMECKLPPLPEQGAIAAILTAVDDAIQATQAVIDQTRVVKTGMLAAEFARFETGRLGESAAFITSGSRGWSQFYADSGDLFLQSRNIRSGRLDLSDPQFVALPGNTEGKRTVIAHQDILITITGNSVGNVALASGLPDGPAYVSQHVGLVRLKSTALAPVYVQYLCPEGPGNKQLWDMQYGQSKPGLNLENLRSLRVPLVQDDDLPRLHAAVSCYDATMATEQAKFEALKVTKQGLMHDLLTGTVRVPGVAA